MSNIEIIQADTTSYALPVFKILGKEGSTAVRIQNIRINDSHFNNIGYSNNRILFLRNVELVNSNGKTIYQKYSGRPDYRLTTLFIPPGHYETIDAVINSVNEYLVASLYALYVNADDFKESALYNDRFHYDCYNAIANAVRGLEDQDEINEALKEIHFIELKTVRGCKYLYSTFKMIPISMSYTTNTSFKYTESKAADLDINIETEVMPTVLYYTTSIQLSNSEGNIARHDELVNAISSFYRRFEQTISLWEVLGIPTRELDAKYIIKTQSTYVYSVYGTHYDECIYYDDGSEAFVSTASSYTNNNYSIGIPALSIPDKLWVCITEHKNIDNIIKTITEESALSVFDLVEELKSRISKKNELEQNLIIPINKSILLKNNSTIYIFILGNTTAYTIPLQQTSLQLERL